MGSANLVLAHTFEQLKGALEAGPRTVVMTMGALHQGHLDLVRAAQGEGGQVVVTIFVNPLQFGPGEDYERYPRTLEADLAALAQANADGIGRRMAVYAPSPGDMYPQGRPAVTVRAGALGERFEGAVRPGHFDGVLTVVLKLLRRTGAAAAVFGLKDAQQLAAIRRMNADLDLGVKIIAVPTRREADGLALSSRNAYLSPLQRRAALALPQAIAAGAAAAGAGADPAEIRQVARAAMGRLPQPELPEYLDLVDPATFAPVPAGWVGPAWLIGAFQAGPARLIDNAAVVVGAAGVGA
ncbi:MAG: pantoate--beta-alanine ligase [Bifidobacteriaceae bacterium]|jgi:pantoate--beta-alanine ligase|nr:pantoate--beta-alanine ligase [Bifidobacteriaceae bacterium]